MGLSFGSKHDYGEKENSNRKLRDRDGDDGIRGKMETISNHPRNRAEYASHLTQNKRKRDGSSIIFGEPNHSTP